MKIKLNELNVLYVNMDKDVDRDKQVNRMFKNFGFTKVSRIPGISTPDWYFNGNNQSMLNALSRYDKEPIIIFEDDAFPYKFVNEIDIPDDADAIWLGFSKWGVNFKDPELDPATDQGFKYEPVPEYPHLSKVFGCLTGHAILFISERFVNKAIDSIKSELDQKERKVNAYDLILGRLQPSYNVYTFNIPIFCQNDSGKPYMIDYTTAAIADI